ncbi:MAG: PRC-barrel domain-containing protein [Candidatus Thermoplasmatota archaeon]|jgi:hypothetical protein|nr:PRC-barrel domain-containing protein [Candidatus Thermoplasmatota archaeon]
MHIFNKNKTKTEESSANPEKEIDETLESLEGKKIIKKRTRIGFRRREEIKEPGKKVVVENIKQPELEKDPLLDLIPVEKNVPAEEKQLDDKKKTLIKKDMIGKPVFLEDTGEKLGTVFDIIYDGEKNLVGYKIKDIKSDAVLSFQIDQFDEDKNGLIFLPSWYTKSLKNIEKLEFKDRISPELTALLTDDSVSNKELYEIFVKYDDEMAKYIEEAIYLKEMLLNRLKVLEKQRLALRDELIDLTEKRLIKDIDRKEFSENVMEHRRKVNIIDVNINKCKELLERLDKTSFGVLGKNQIISELETEEHILDKNLGDVKETKKPLFSKDENEIYKNKYYTLKEQFEQLESEYLELKSAVEKLMHKNEI